MSGLFPFDLPSGSAWYAVLSVVTLWMHVVFMTYVLGGTLMLGVAGLRGMLGRSAPESVWRPVTVVLKDWMPFVLSAAITAGVAPLLFVQVLYQREFYTANLLMFHRWMSILPVLIVAFYMLYLLKAHRLERREALRGVVALAVAACVVYVAWSWVENHLLSLDRGAWAAQYESEAMVYARPAVPLRVGFWIAGALFTAPALIAWQLRGGASGVSEGAAHRSARALAGLAVVSGAVACAAVWPVLGRVGDAGWAPGAKVWLGVATGGAVVALVAWAAVWASRRIGAGALSVASAGSGVFWLGALVAREGARWAVVGTDEVRDRHMSVGTAAGLVVFLVFAVIGVVTIGWVAVTVMRASAARGRDA